MTLTDLQNNLAGSWAGTNLLRLSWLTPTDYVSPTDLKVATAAKGKFLTLAYTWSHENIPQEGLLLLGYDNNQAVATAAWVDSWHQSNKVMLCQGTIDQQGTIDLRGWYAAPPDPDWGWRIVIKATTRRDLQITMYNCSPAGEEELAVQAEYKRVLT